MKYLKKFNEMMMLENEIDNFVDSAVAKYQKKIDDCMLHLTDKYETTYKSYLQHKFFYHFTVPAGEMGDFIKCMEESFSSLVFEVNAHIEIEYLKFDILNGISSTSTYWRTYKTTFDVVKKELTSLYSEKECTIEITIS